VTAPIQDGSPVVDWDSSSAGLLFYQGRGYRFHGQTPQVDASLWADRAIGTTALRWQSGGVFPAGTNIYSVADQPPERMLALKAGEQTTFFQEDDQATALFESVQVVVGTVTSVGSPLCAGSRCQEQPGQGRPGTISIPATIAVDRVLHGRLPTAQEIEVRQLGTLDAALPHDRAVALAPGSVVLLFLQPGQLASIGDFGHGDYYWTMQDWLYRVETGQVLPVNAQGNGDLPVSLAHFDAALAEVFLGVQPRDPSGPRPTVAPTPTATGVLPSPLPTALPVSTPRK
jgi:hypothetical protein